MYAIAKSSQLCNRFLESIDCDRLEKIVSSRPNAKAYRLEKIGETIKETPLIPIYLNAGHQQS